MRLKNHPPVYIFKHRLPRHFQALRTHFQTCFSHPQAWDRSMAHLQKTPVLLLQVHNCLWLHHSLCLEPKNRMPAEYTKYREEYSRWSKHWYGVTQVLLDILVMDASLASPPDWKIPCNRCTWDCFRVRPLKIRPALVLLTIIWIQPFAVC